MRKLLYRLYLTATLFSLPASAAANPLQQGANSAHNSSTPSQLFGSSSVFQIVANTLIFITGALAVLALILGGLRYVISGGDSTRVKEAKDTILYGIIGVVVAILAYALVSFIVSSFSH